jgi:hypothetical protein
MTSTFIGDIHDRMLAYANQDDYYVTRNLLKEGANEIARLRQIVDNPINKQIPPCCGHAYQPDDCTSLHPRPTDRGVGK